MKSFFLKERISHKCWAWCLFGYFLLVLLRCVLADYLAISNQTEIIDVNELLNKEPRLLFFPINFVLIPLSTYYVLSKIKPIEKLFFLGLIVVSLLSFSRSIIDYTILWLFIINHSIAALILVCFLPIYISYKRGLPDRK
jgi:hypothetical protein